jgi:hypothetical protein
MFSRPSCHLTNQLAPRASSRKAAARRYNKLPITKAAGRPQQVEMDKCRSQAKLKGQACHGPRPAEQGQGHRSSHQEYRPEYTRHWPRRHVSCTHTIWIALPVCSWRYPPQGRGMPPAARGKEQELSRNDHRFPLLLVCASPRVASDSDDCPLVGKVLTSQHPPQRKSRHRCCEYYRGPAFEM